MKSSKFSVNSSTTQSPRSTHRSQANHSIISTTTTSKDYGESEIQKMERTSTIAYIYDIPKDDGYNSSELTKILQGMGYKCSVQIQRFQSSKPFLSAIVKFNSVAELQLALMNLKCFKLRDGKKEARILPFDSSLKKNVNTNQLINEKLYDPNDFDYQVLIKHDSIPSLVSTKSKTEAQLSLSSKIDSQVEEESKETTYAPDNSTAQVNLFLKNLPKTWGLNDVHDAFKDYGEIKSAKISLNPQTHESKGYGFIWFKDPQSATQVLEDQKAGKFSFKVEPYVPRLAKIQKEANKITPVKDNNVIAVYNFDEQVTEDDIQEYFQQSGGDVTGCKFMEYYGVMKIALVQFKTTQMAQEAILYAEKTIFRNSFLSIQALTQDYLEELQEEISQLEKAKQMADENLKSPAEDIKSSFTRLIGIKVSDIPIAITMQEFQKELSKYGKITNFSFITNPRRYSSHSKFSFDNQEDVKKLIEQGCFDLKGFKLVIQSYTYLLDNLSKSNSISSQNSSSYPSPFSSGEKKQKSRTKVQSGGFSGNYLSFKQNNKDKEFDEYFTQKVQQQPGTNQPVAYPQQQQCAECCHCQSTPMNYPPQPQYCYNPAAYPIPQQDPHQYPQFVNHQHQPVPYSYPYPQSQTVCGQDCQIQHPMHKQQSLNPEHFPFLGEDSTESFSVDKKKNGSSKTTKKAQSWKKSPRIELPLDQRVEKAQKRNMREMTDCDKVKLKRMQDIEKLQKDIYSHFNQGYQNFHFEICKELLEKFSLLMIEKNQDTTKIEEHDEFGKRMQERVMGMNDAILRSWMSSFAAFCILMDDVYIKVFNHE
eukprot:403341592